MSEEKKYEPLPAYIVSMDTSRGKDKALVVVGRQIDGNMVIVNAMRGRPAYDLFQMLTEPPLKTEAKQ